MAYVIKTCEGCGNSFENRPGKNGKVYAAKRYCTRTCWLTKYNRDDKTHGVKGARAAANTWRGRRGESHGGNAYVKENQRHQHRVVAERILQRRLLPGEVVHHEDRNRKNNDPANLIVFASQSDHASHHANCLNKQQVCTCSCIRLLEVMPK